MKTLFPLILIFMTVIALSGASEDVVVEPISFYDLNQRPVTGKLGYPLGTICEVQATIVSTGQFDKPAKGLPEEFNSKWYRDTYLLKVTHVANEPLSEPQWFAFENLLSTPPKPGKYKASSLATHSFELYELMTGEKPERVSTDTIRDLESDYANKIVKLVAYEIGSFTGTPSNITDYTNWDPGPGFRFSTSLIVVAEQAN